MYVYPQLTVKEQSTLPNLIAKPKAIPSKFEDSTHTLWHCETIDGPMVLKLCSVSSIQQSNFWVGLNHLFDLGFPETLSGIQKTHTLVDTKGLFNTWGTRLSSTIQRLVARLENTITIPPILLQRVLKQTASLNESVFVPIMPDLRWDQFRYTTEVDQITLIDLDAFVIAPPSLELVLLEYILTPSQMTTFKAIYTKTHDWPDYSAYKSCYQLLLFLMQVLGKTDLEKWMRQQ